MKRLTMLFITLCIGLFVWIALFGVNFIQTTPMCQEGFASTATAITRASDCNCLPGYIPSSETSEYNGKIFSSIIAGNTRYLFNPDGTKDTYWIKSENPCGIPNINTFTQPNTGNYPYLDHSEIFGAAPKYSYNGVLQCNMVHKKEASGIFFCQNLANPEKRRNCY